MGMRCFLFDSCWKNDWDSSLEHILRGGNQSADALVKLGADSDVGMVTFNEPPESLISVLLGSCFPEFNSLLFPLYLPFVSSLVCKKKKLNKSSDGKKIDTKITTKKKIERIKLKHTYITKTKHI